MSEVAADHSLPERQTRALDNCEALIRLYRRHADTARHWYHFLQITGITLGGLTPVALLINGAPAWIPAAMAALGAIAGGLNATFHWHEEWLRNTYFAQALASEQERYLARATEPYRTTLESQTALDNFVARIEDIRSRTSGCARRPSGRTTSAPPSSRRESRLNGQTTVPHLVRWGVTPGG